MRAKVQTLAEGGYNSKRGGRSCFSEKNEWNEMVRAV